MRVLLTGGTGFFGKSILDYAARHGTGWGELVILARHPEEFAARYPDLAGVGGVEFLKGDVRDFGFPAKTFDAVIHAAAPARADVPDAEMESIIVDGTRRVLDFAKVCGCRKFMFISSGGVYGRGFTVPVSEAVEPRPVTVYGKAKLAAERMCADSGLFTLLPRCFAFVGRYLDRDAHFAIGNFIRDALARRPIVIQGDGTPVRSYLYADDLVEWLWAILERGESGRPYNVGSGQAVPVRELAQTVGRVLGSPAPVRVLGRAVPGAADFYVPDVTRAQKELGLCAKTALLDAISASACAENPSARG